MSIRDRILLRFQLFGSAACGAFFLLSQPKLHQSKLCQPKRPEVSMVNELNVLSEWIPEQMGPGTIFVLENAGDMGEGDDPYWAVLSCPECGTLGLITRKQIAGLISVICGADCCSAQYFIRDNDIVPRKPC